MSTSPSLKRAVYAGTFDPITIGHFDIMLRALSVFDELYVAVAAGSPRKSGKEPLFSIEERVEMIQDSISSHAKSLKAQPGDSKQLVEGLTKRVFVDSFDGLLVDFVKKVQAHVIVRGLRAVSDYEYEAQLAHINRHLNREIETVFLVTSKHCSFISASIVRNVAANGGDVSGLVPENVIPRLKRAYLST